MSAPVTTGGAESGTTAPGDGKGHPPPALPRRIAYTQTRVFSPDPALLRRNRVITALDGEAATAAYKVLRTQVRQRLAANRWNTVAVTSPRGGEGKTLTAVNLAISLALEVNHSVLLADLDLRRPGVHRCFGYEPELGVSDYLVDEVPIHRMLFNPGIERLVVLPGREPVYNSSEALSSHHTQHLVEELRTRYAASRYVIFDLPPVLSADDAMAFAPYVDAVLMVVEEGRTTQDDLLRAVDYLNGTPLIGTVLNRSTDGDAGRP